ncbi:hypothetical protein GCM10010156_49010 [Planobispora rosea]|uniref:Uncharacterized protein n=1 Tax=Planobispora rosea TaxID=35762 RepID=A0A8J3S5Q8_PLARO|nr:hypothetical protein [Planobispora rosea]GGS84580.1 hypothetical protein GCM10010156_49010 [Planobispora rosea]GIH86412.1 hypothetical protein Pro02_48200 [Planobispora rosea]
MLPETSTPPPDHHDPRPAATGLDVTAWRAIPLGDPTRNPRCPWGIVAGDVTDPGGPALWIKISAADRPADVAAVLLAATRAYLGAGPQDAGDGPVPAPERSESEAIAIVQTHVAYAEAGELLELARTCPAPAVRAAGVRITASVERLRERLAAVLADARRQVDAETAPVAEPAPVDEHFQEIPAAAEESAVDQTAPLPAPVRPAARRRGGGAGRPAPATPRRAAAKTRPAARRSDADNGLAHGVSDRGMFAVVYPPTEAEAAVVRSLCARYGTTAAETAELIDMLGLDAQESQEAIAG